MNVKCPSCKKIFSIPDNYFGKEIKCLKCNHLFVVDSRISLFTKIIPYVFLTFILILLSCGFLYRSNLKLFLEIGQNNFRNDKSNELPNFIDKGYLSDDVIMLGWILELNKKGGSAAEMKEESDFFIKKNDIIEMIEQVDSNYPLLLEHKKEIIDLLDNSSFVFFKRDSYIDKKQTPLKGLTKILLPINFTTLNNKSVLMIGSIYSNVVFNNVNVLLNTPKKRASTFIQKEILPEILNENLSSSISDLNFKYIGLVYLYGNKNFIEEYSYISQESLCIVIPLREYSGFIKRELSQEEFLKKCFVYLKSEGTNFIKVELTLN